MRKIIQFLLFLPLTLAAMGQSSGSFPGTSGGTTYTGTAPIVVTGPVISCPTCGTSNPMSGMNAGEIPVAATATTVTSSKPLAGAGAGITTGPTSAVNGEIAMFSGTAGLIADSTLAVGSLVTLTGAQTLTNKSIVATQLTGTLAAAQEPAHTGDVTNTAGSLALTIAANAVTGAKMANSTVTATQLAAQYSKGSCTEVWGGSGTSFALTSGDDAISNNTCYNDSGVTRTITAVKCRSSIASNTTTVNPTFGASGTGTTILSGALTCGSSLAYSSTGTVSNASWTTGTGVNPVMGGTLTGVSVAMILEFTQ